MTRIRQRLSDMLRTSDLKDEDRHLLLGYLQFTGSDNLHAVAALFEDDPSAPKKLLANIRAKVKAMQSRDTEALEKILEEEKEMIANLGS